MRAGLLLEQCPGRSLGLSFPLRRFDHSLGPRGGIRMSCFPSCRMTKGKRSVPKSDRYVAKFNSICVCRSLQRPHAKPMPTPIPTQTVGADPGLRGGWRHRCPASGSPDPAGTNGGDSGTPRHSPEQELCKSESGIHLVRNPETQCSLTKSNQGFPFFGHRPQLREGFLLRGCLRL